MSNDVILKKEQEREIKTVEMYNDLTSFQNAWKMSTTLSKSNMIPQEFQNRPENCMIALDMCSRLGMSPFIIMQNIYIVHGKPSFSSKFAIAMINNSGRFEGGLRFKLEGKDENLSCYAYATYKGESEPVKGTKVTIAMAKAEGWWSKKSKKTGQESSKWPTMTEKMIKYRAASFFASEYCPDLLLGVSIKEEIEDSQPRSVESIVEQEIEENANKEIIDVVEEKEDVKEETPPVEEETKDESDEVPY